MFKNKLIHIIENVKSLFIDEARNTYMFKTCHIDLFFQIQSRWNKITKLNISQY